MILFQKILFPIAQDIFDMEHISQEEDKLIIPLKQTKDNQARYDDAYALIGENSGFLIDITYSQLNLGVRLNAVEQFNFTISASYKEFCLDDVPDELLETYDNQVSVSLTDEELTNLSPVLSNLFCNDINIENLRSQTVKSIPREHMTGKKLFAEEITQMGYHSVWTSSDLKKCVLISVEDYKNKDELVKAYIF